MGPEVLGTDSSHSTCMAEVGYEFLVLAAVVVNMTLFSFIKQLEWFQLFTHSTNSLCT